MSTPLLHGSFSHSRIIAAQADAVFAAFAQPALRRRWFTLPSDPADTQHDLDFRVGGGEIVRSRVALSGVVEIVEYRSRFIEIVSDRRIVWTCELRIDEQLRLASLATVELTAQGDQTLLEYTEQYVFLAYAGDGRAERAERENGTRLLFNGLPAVARTPHSSLAESSAP